MTYRASYNPGQTSQGKTMSTESILKYNVNELQSLLQESYIKIELKNLEIEKLREMLVEAVVEKS
jgi:hypothetical protein